MNLLPVRQACDGLWLGPGSWLPLPGLPLGVTTLGIRPEHLQLDPKGSLLMQVEWVEALGAELVITSYSIHYTKLYECRAPGS